MLTAPIRLQRMPGQKPVTGRVRWYHVSRRGERCWAFTTTKQAWSRFRQGGPLEADGATYPDGRPVVPDGTDPLLVDIRCGSCSTYQVECQQLVFFEE